MVGLAFDPGPGMWCCRVGVWGWGRRAEVTWKPQTRLMGEELVVMLKESLSKGFWLKAFVLACLLVTR